MKNLITCLMILPLSLALKAQDQFTNNGNLTLHPGANITFFGDVVNNGMLSDSGAMSTLAGTSPQTIGGSSSTAFNYLSLRNSSGASPQVSLDADVAVKQTLTMAAGDVNLNSNEFTIGTSGTAPGLLDYIAGSMYGGTLKRWFAPSVLTIGDNAHALFPMGTSTGDFRPLWVAWTSSLSNAGSLSVEHNPNYTTEIIPASHIDTSWNGGTLVEGVTTSTWVLSTGNGFSLSSSTGEIRFGGEGFSFPSLADLNASLLSSTTGTFEEPTSVNTVLEVNRAGLSTTNLANTWRIGTSDTVSSIFPITLLSFYTTCEGDAREIVWTTATEQNNDYFSIERSRDGQNWETIRTVEGAGTSTIYHSYSIIDDEPYAGRTYYRLQQTDLGGASMSFGTIKSESCGARPDFEVYPNPSNGVVQVVVESQEKIISVDIGNAINPRIYSSPICPATIDFSGLPDGVYFVHIHFASTTITKRVLIEK